MVSIIVLKERLADGEDWVLFSPEGDVLDLSVPVDIGPATLLVSPVTDALKTSTADGLVDESLNRDDMWEVRGYVLNRVVVARLENEVMTPRGLYDAVSNLHFGWQIKTLADIR